MSFSTRFAQILELPMSYELMADAPSASEKKRDVDVSYPGPGLDRATRHSKSFQDTNKHSNDRIGR